MYIYIYMCVCVYCIYVDRDPPKIVQPPKPHPSPSNLHLYSPNTALPCPGHHQQDLAMQPQAELPREAQVEPHLELLLVLWCWVACRTGIPRKTMGKP